MIVTGTTTQVVITTAGIQDIIAPIPIETIIPHSTFQGIIPLIAFYNFISNDRNTSSRHISFLLNLISKKPKQHVLLPPSFPTNKDLQTPTHKSGSFNLPPLTGQALNQPKATIVTLQTELLIALIFPLLVASVLSGPTVETKL
jgi:hypothetical protein